MEGKNQEVMRHLLCHLQPDQWLCHSYGQKIPTSARIIDIKEGGALPAG